MITKLDEKTRIYEGIVNVLRFTKSLNIDLYMRSFLRIFENLFLISFKTFFHLLR